MVWRRSPRPGRRRSMGSPRCRQGCWYPRNPMGRRCRSSVKASCRNQDGSPHHSAAWRNYRAEIGRFFEISLGGRPFNDVVYFNPSRSEQDANGDEGRRGGGAEVEAWQILSPVRAGETGVDGLNRWLQKSFRRQSRTWAEPEKYWQRKTCKPLGPQGILTATRSSTSLNAWRYDVYPKSEKPYLANGEIGLVVGQFKAAIGSRKACRGKWRSSSRPSSGSSTDSERDFGDEGDAPLELAYALTIHKAQGSEFGITFIVVPNPCRLLSRELLYTALTRQREQVVILHQGDVRALLKLSSAEHSETVRRLTNLFKKSEACRVRRQIPRRRL